MAATRVSHFNCTLPRAVRHSRLTLRDEQERSAVVQVSGMAKLSGNSISRRSLAPVHSCRTNENRTLARSG